MPKLLPNVQQITIEPVILANVAPGTLIYTDAYNIYNRLVQWGYGYKTVNRSEGEYAHNEFTIFIGGFIITSLKHILSLNLYS